MTSLHEPPLFAAPKHAERILVAGAGGGFDVYAGLPLAFALMGLGKSVHLANLSFSALDLIDTDAWCEPNLVAITPATTGHDRYFPERTLARWLRRVWTRRSTPFPGRAFARSKTLIENWYDDWILTRSCWSTVAPTS